jgi:hypothetical protein
MKYRKLRIAWSVGCGILCVLLIAFWVRGVQTTESVIWRFRPDRIIGSSTGQGAIGFQFSVVNPGNVDWASGIRSWSNDSIAPVKKHWDFVHEKQPDTTIWMSVPHWFAALLLAAAGGISWIRFSLRTLLIGITVVAVVLGLAVWAAGN